MSRAMGRDSGPPKRPRVLVAEDDDDVRLALVTMLRRDGYELDEARDGHELLECVANRPPDIILTDVCLPGVDGLSVLAGLRETGWATPIVLVTAYASDAVRARAKELGADGFFEKPFDLDDIRAAVRSLAGRGGWRAVAPTYPDFS